MRVNKLINKIKFSSYKLYKNRQIPQYLFNCICKLGQDSSIELIKLYEQLTEHYLRIPGYYGKYAEIEYECEKEIKDILRKHGY